jgi:hypothetical protein
MDLNLVWAQRICKITNDTVNDGCEGKEDQFQHFILS